MAHGMLGVCAFLFIIKGINSQSSDCSYFPFDREIHFNESDQNGTIIYSTKPTNDTKQKWSIRDPVGMTVLLENPTYIIKLDKKFKIDKRPCSAQDLNFSVTMYCMPEGGGVSVKQAVTFIIDPVNNYVPKLERNQKIDLEEGNITSSEPVFDAGYYTRNDQDCPKPQYIYSLASISSQLDMSRFFSINSTSGYVYQIVGFDWESTKIQCGTRTGSINVTIQDGSIVSYGLITVNLKNVDDTPPTFVRSECTTTCYNCKLSDIVTKMDYSQQGLITTLKVIDPDTDSQDITIDIVSVSPSRYSENINLMNRTLYLQSSFASFSNYNETSDFNVEVLVQASHNISGNPSKILTINISVHVPPGTTTEATTETTSQASTPIPQAPTTKKPDANTKSDSNQDLLIILLPIAGALLLIIIIVVVCKMKTKSKAYQKYKLRKKGLNGHTNESVQDQEETKNPMHDTNDAQP